MSNILAITVPETKYIETSDIKTLVETLESVMSPEELRKLADGLRKYGTYRAASFG